MCTLVKIIAVTSFHILTPALFILLPTAINVNWDPWFWHFRAWTLWEMRPWVTLTSFWSGSQCVSWTPIPACWTKPWSTCARSSLCWWRWTIVCTSTRPPPSFPTSLSRSVGQGRFPFMSPRRQRRRQTQQGLLMLPKSPVRDVLSITATLAMLARPVKWKAPRTCIWSLFLYASNYNR